MGSEWRTKCLGEVSTNFDSVRVPVKESDRRFGCYPYYGASGVVDHIDGYLFDGEYLLVAEDGENLRTQQTPVAFLATGKFWVNNHAHIIQGNDLGDTRFLMYALRQADISGYLTGSTMPKLTQGNLNRIPVSVPPLPEQKAIAHILGTLDDKIELNRRMNETLEAMARAVFKSWFVDFDPVHAKAKGRKPDLPAEALAKAGGMDAETAKLFPDSFVDSETGKIPKGWKLGTVGEMARLSRDSLTRTSFPMRSSTITAYQRSTRGVDIFKAVGLDKPEISILSEEFLREFQKMPQKDLAVEMFRKLMKDEIVRRAKIRTMVKRILRKYDYPPDKQEKATTTVLQQAELLCGDWAEDKVA